MKKAFREWAFDLFTKRITIKVAKLPDDEKIEFLLNKFLNELVDQGHNIDGSANVEYINIFGCGKTVDISSNSGTNLAFKRTK